MRDGRKTILLWVGALIASVLWMWTPVARGAPQSCSSLFFSEYVEGSSYNKAVEIFNGTTQDEDLTGYEIRIYRNGGADYDHPPIALSGVLASGDVFVVAHSSASFAGSADWMTTKLDFNGDDGVALVRNGVILDFIGDTLGDPGSQWGSGETSTRDHTLRRKSWVAGGDANPSDPFDPAAEWDGYPRDTIDGLGWHTSSCSGEQPTPTLSPTPTIAPTATPAATPTPIPDHIFINEFMAAPASGQKEYIELFNANAFAVDVSGWQLDDIAGGSRPYTLPNGSVVQPGGLLLFRRTFGLNNDGDVVRLLAPDGSLRDSYQYGHARKGGAWSRMGDGAAAWTEKYPPSPGAPNAAARLTFSGHLYLGVPPDRNQVISDHNIGLYGYDGDVNAAQWLINGYVGRDGSWSIAFDTAQGLYFHYVLRPSARSDLQWSGVSSPTGILLPPDRIRYDTPASGVYADNDFWMAPKPPTPTPLPLDFVYLNEFMPSPKNSDFDGDGEANYLDEYIELYNATDAAVDLSGWLLDDREGGTRPWRLPDGTIIQARGFLLFFRKETGIALNNGGDSVRLLAPDGVTEGDRMDYDHSSADTPWSRTVDGGGAWTEGYPPSPGGPNVASTVTPTPTITPTPSMSVTPTPTPTVTPTATLSPTPVTPGFITLNEFLPAPKNVDFNGDGEANLLDEYIELYNPHDSPLSLDGWMLDDGEGGSRPWRLPGGTIIGARDFLLFFRSETGVVLNNDGDDVRLISPDGQVIDAFTYLEAQWDQPWSRTVDGSGGWTILYPPSPGGPNIAPPPTPTPWPTPAPGQVTLNELLPAPHDIDWDGDGAAGYMDEWIELYNAGVWPADVSGWRLWRGPLGEDGLPAGHAYRLPAETVIDPGGYLLIFRRQSKLPLPAADAVLHLARPVGDGWLVVDSFAWRQSPGYDRSFSRYPDGSGPWDTRAVTPGQPNQPLPTPVPPPTSSAPPAATNPAYGPVRPIASAYQAPLKSAITLVGRITVQPGAFSPRILYLQDDSGGIMAYLRRGEYPPLKPGDRVQAQGALKSYHGQRELVIPDASRVTLLGPGAPPAPTFLRTGQVNDAVMGRLLRVAGRVQNVQKYSFDLDDGSGPIRIEHPYKAPWQLPALQPGMTVSVIGVLARYKDALHILPRSQQDISPPPGVLPTTGGNIKSDSHSN